jgi:hypothetical protein
MLVAAHTALPGARPRVWRCIRSCGLLGAVGLCWLGAGVTSAAPAFDDPAPVVSRDGGVQLSWPGALGDYEVELRQGEGSRVVYRGRMPSAHLSGLREGDYELRLRQRDGGEWSPWSPAKALQVRHHSPFMVYALLGLGLLTFAGTAFVVLRASRGAA